MYADLMLGSRRFGRSLSIDPLDNEFLMVFLWGLILAVSVFLFLHLRRGAAHKRE